MLHVLSMFACHGDRVEAVRDGNAQLPYFRALGRCDDTMNLGGIKVSSVELERVCNAVPAVKETAAIAVTAGGLGQLVVFVVFNDGNKVDKTPTTAEFQKVAMQSSIKRILFHCVVLATLLLQTHKVMRRLLRGNHVAPNTSAK